MKKHVYMIIAHNEFELLKLLVSQLDDSRNDIYIHIDRKVKRKLYMTIKKQICDFVKYSNIYFVKRINVMWGGDTQIKCELNLLKAAYKNNYEYYHLLSGVDFPIKSQDYIHDFFNKHKNMNFLDVDLNHDIEDYKSNRIKYYHFFQNKLGREYKKEKFILYKLDRVFNIFQKKLHIERYKNIPIEVRKGAQWFSINDLMVKEILNNEKVIKKYFYYSLCADEMFLQSIAYSSNLKKKIVNDSLRLIDWKRGGPYIYGINDLDFLKNSEKLFARKFSKEKSYELIRKIKEIT